ncbi:EAL domain-containing protein [Nitrincola sp.]|uniref:bifunctional diguanylate cyclase/phosphodiesterase n=1 Tax=Nitrincola sp. TaxID=1926584 RepID=UPI003A9409BF
MRISYYIPAVIVLALVYASAGVLVAGSGLHDQIVPLWIPSGIGLAMVIRFGLSFLPGVFLGNLLFNIWLPLGWQEFFDPEAILVAIFIASGATLQTALAAYLIEKYHAHPLRPQSGRGLVKFIVFAGFLTCTLNATVGTFSVHTMANTQGSAGLFNDWLSWWMGDAFGAILVTPLLLALLEPKTHLNAKRRLRLSVQLALVILAVLVINKIFLSHLDQQLRRSFEQDVKVLDAQVQAVVQHNLADLTRLGKEFSGPLGADPDVFQAMVAEIQQYNPSVRAYSWDPIVASNELDAFEAATRQLLNEPEYRVYGESLHVGDPLIPVQMVEPLEANRAALGFNLLSIEDRRRWVIESQEQGRPVATQILNLTQAPDEPGMLILHPVYVLSDQQNPLMGNRLLTGFIVGVFTVDKMFSAALEMSGIEHINFKLFESDTATPFFSTTTASQAPRPILTDHFQISIAQQTWDVYAEAGPDYLSMNPASNAQLMQTLLVLVGCMGAMLVLSMHDRERLLMDLVKKQTRTLAHQARHDVLTGLPNRYMLMERVNQRIHDVSEHNFSLLFIDLDRFKMINDSLGHQIGDQLLKGMANNLNRRLVNGCELFRTGGDEFILLVTGEASRAEQEAERFLNLCTIPLQIDGHKLQMTASIGISHFPEHGQDLDTLIKHADTAMYKAKAQGKNCYELYSSQLTTQAVQSFQLEQDLRIALNTRQLLLHYQPQFSLKTGDLCGLEVLVRWQHPEKGMMPPGEFIPLAEETNLIVPLGWQVIELACEQILVWQEQGKMVPPVAINISPKQLLEADFIEHINAILARFGIARSQIELEITESLIMQDPDYAIEQLNSLRHAGYRLAIDDFGIGYSSLNRLKQLPLDRLKIDYSFTRDIGTNPKDEAIIITVIALGKSLNIEVLAEGVETEAQLAFLKAQGCDSVQGYLLGRPVPEQELISLHAA